MMLKMSRRYQLYNGTMCQNRQVHNKPQARLGPGVLVAALKPKAKRHPPSNYGHFRKFLPKYDSSIIYKVTISKIQEKVKAYINKSFQKLVGDNCGL